MPPGVSQGCPLPQPSAAAVQQTAHGPEQPSQAWLCQQGTSLGLLSPVPAPGHRVPKQLAQVHEAKGHEKREGFSSLLLISLSFTVVRVKMDGDFLSWPSCTWTLVL